jgi:hypothetical protein
LTPQQIKEYLDELNWCRIDDYVKKIYKIINKILKIFKQVFQQPEDWLRRDSRRYEQQNLPARV